MQVRVGGAYKEITGASVRVGGSWRRLQAIKVYSDSAWRTVATFSSPMSLALSRSTISRIGSNSTLTTGTVTGTPTGGQGPFTYAWTKQSGDTITASSPANASSTFRATNLAIDETRNAVFRLTCTDAFGSSDSEDVTVTITRIESAIITGGTQ
jgi:predicted flavoprotein YhiN